MYTLKRVTQTNEGTFGVLLDEHNYPLCVTCEDPWLDNKQGVSCIPVGKYKVSRHDGTKYKDVWVVNDVPGRSAILFHQGNTIKDTRGCILVGEKFGIVSGLPAILDSVKTLNMLRKALPQSFELNIKF